MTQPWDAEIVVSGALAVSLIEAQFPELAPVTAAPFGAGFDNTALLINGQLLFRFPRRQVAVPLLEAETGLLPWLAPRLPVAVPVPRWVGHATAAFPWPFAGYVFLVGRTGCAVNLDAQQRTALARPLGHFLAALHAVPATEAAVRGAGFDSLARLELTKLIPGARADLERLAGLGIVPDERPLRDILDAAPASYRPRGDTVVHGDCYARHLLIGPAHDLVGVIDWGDVHRGDPAVDLMVGHAFLPPEARDRFREAYGHIDAITWQLARLRALWHTLKVLTYAHAVSDGDLAREGRVALGYLSAE